ncbi:hypothetical protein O9373_13310, partial [Proteus mirabilis]|nr:hypothetical protein [Proteus mirabilis]
MAEKTQSDKFKAAKKSTLVSVFVNIFLSIFQITIGFFSHSQGLILMNPLMILVKIIKLRWIHILSYDQMV